VRYETSPLNVLCASATRGCSVALLPQQLEKWARCCGSCMPACRCGRATMKSCGCATC
jgi:hypothetical protein